MTNTPKLTQREQQKLDIIETTLAGKMTKAQAALLLGVTPRQIKRLKRSVEKYGAIAVIHKLKGKRSNHHIDQEIKKKALSTIQAQYLDFKPTFAAEKLSADQSINISGETARRWMSEAGIWKPRRHKQVIYRSWRPRKDFFGELEQFDGSYHLWFEDRYCDESGDPIETCLLAAIDDATGQITHACFAANEGVVAVMTFWKTYIEKHGKPLAIYLDKFSTYKINYKAALDNKDLITQFQRVMQLLSITLITANSPEAKGRIERLFQTLQDRLVKEMRLANICSPGQGNTFLQEVFLPKFNSQFTVVPAKDGDLHRPLLPQEKRQLDQIFSVQEIRKVNRDFTIQFKNNWYQLKEVQPTTVRPLVAVKMTTFLDDSLHIMLNGYELDFFILPTKPPTYSSTHPLILTTHPLNYKPPTTHPWKNFAFGKSH